MVVFQIGSQKFPWFLLLELRSRDTNLDQQISRCYLFYIEMGNIYIELKHLGHHTMIVNILIRSAKEVL